MVDRSQRFPVREMALNSRSCFLRMEVQFEMVLDNWSQFLSAGFIHFKLMPPVKFLPAAAL